MTTLVMTGVILAAMVALSVWAAQQLPDDGPVPVHFDLRGKADKLGSRWVTLGLVPIIYVPIAALMVWLAHDSPDKAGELLTGAAVAGLITLSAHGYIMWLLVRWAARR